jgi:hypothetical protein
LYLKYTWAGRADATVIQNGGFSLRSAKLLAMPARMNLPFYSGSKAILQNEDMQLSGLFRPQLEAQGLKFAPLDVAKTFALEHLGPQFHDDLSFARLFGLHGKERKFVGPRKIKYTITSAYADRFYRENELIAFLRGLGYEIEFAAA